MSSKTPSPGKADPRIAPKEVMVTRRKSAQMKRQLRTKDRSMKHLTDLLKSPTKDQEPTKNPSKRKQASPKAKQSLLKSVEKIQNLPRKTFKLSKVLRNEIQLVEDEEYYPNKRKRKLAVNKVVLKPKPSLKVVGEISGSVKRKYAVPHKALDCPTPPQVQQQSLEPPSPEPARLTMAEAIRIMDERLTDEDMMEILTCPSPVWWEDPPDESYIEEALFTRTPTKKKDATPPKSAPMEIDANVEKDVDTIILIPNLSAKSDKFLKKRSKLEDLLGNIKNKSNTKHNNEKNTSNKELVVRCTDRIKSNENKNDAVKHDQLKAKISESDDEIIFHNSSMNEDELLKDLENMDIPIANQNQNDVIVIDDDDDDFLDKPASEGAGKEVETKENKKPDEQETTCDDTIKADEKKVVNDIKIESVNETKSPGDVKEPKNLSTLQKCNSSKEISSPKSSDSLSSKSSVTSMSSKDVDTISDTNVRFLLDDEIDDQSKVANKMDSKNEESVKENSETGETGKIDENSVTVYKIIEEISEISTDTNEPKEKVSEKEKSKSKLHEAYKNCIKFYHRRMKMEKKDTDINKNEVAQEEKFITKFCEHCKPSFKKVSDDENVKYCLNCSSIFDSKDCTYCINKYKRYTCVPCKLKFCCAVFYKMHEFNCHNSSREEIKVSDKDSERNIGTSNPVLLTI